MKKITRITLFLFVAIFASALVFAQDDHESSNSNVGRISTSGSAEVRVAPSRVVLTFGVETYNPDLAIAKSENDTKAAGVIALAKQLGVAPKDVQTDYIFVEPVHDGYDDRRAGKFLHYLVRKTIVVLLRDVSKFESILGGSLERGATHVLRVQFEVDDLKRHREKARSDAIKAAKEKAELLSKDLGAKLGRVLNIQEYSYYDPGSNYGGSWYRRYSGGGGASQVSSQAPDDGPVSPTVGDSLALGQIRISAQINVVFELL